MSKTKRCSWQNLIMVKHYDIWSIFNYSDVVKRHMNLKKWFYVRFVKSCFGNCNWSSSYDELFLFSGHCCLGVVAELSGVGQVNVSVRCQPDMPFHVDENSSSGRCRSLQVMNDKNTWLLCVKFPCSLLFYIPIILIKLFIFDCFYYNNK